MFRVRAVLDVDEILDALGFQFGHTCRSARNHEVLVAEQLFHFGSRLCVVVVRCADYDDLGFRFQSGLDALFDRFP